MVNPVNPVNPDKGVIYLRMATALKYRDIEYYQPVHYVKLGSWNLSKREPPVEDIFDVKQWIALLSKLKINGKPLTQEDEYGNKLSYSVTINWLRQEYVEYANLESNTCLLFPPNINKAERERAKRESKLKGIIYHRIIDYNIKYLHPYLPKRPRGD